MSISSTPFTAELENRLNDNINKITAQVDTLKDEASTSRTETAKGLQALTSCVEGLESRQAAHEKTVEEALKNLPSAPAAVGTVITLI